MTSDAAAGTTSTTTRPEPATEGSPDCTPGEVVGTVRCELESAGQIRGYLLQVPASYDASMAIPVVFEFHGFGSDAVEQTEYGGFHLQSEAEGFIAVLPEGRGNPQRWLFDDDDTTLDVSREYPDLAFVVDLIEDLGRRFNIDRDRVYATGYSNGGWMASAVACALPDLFAAVAPVAGIMDFGDTARRTQRSSGICSWVPFR